MELVRTVLNLEHENIMTMSDVIDVVMEEVKADDQNIKWQQEINAPHFPSIVKKLIERMHDWVNIFFCIGRMMIALTKC